VLHTVQPNPAWHPRELGLLQENRWKNVETGREGRHHVHETILQRAVREAVCKANIVKHVGCHMVRHAFATHRIKTG
jgi:site-specific recombinase XerD